MGKKSLTQSTTKKKTTAKKKTAATAGKTAKGKKAPAKTKTGAKKTAPKKASPKKAAAKKAAPAKAVRPTIAELICKKFDTVVPADRYVPPGPAARSEFTAPAFFASDDPAEVERVQSLLKKTFDMAQIAIDGRKAAAEKAAAEKAAAEKAAAEKAAAEKAAAQKAAAEKAAAEKAAAEKAAAEKAAAEKAAAEKAAAEKAAAEKAAAEKAAAEKAAAEKAAAEKAAAQKAAAEKAAAEKATVTYDEPSASAPENAMDKGTRMMVLGLAAGVAFIFLLIIGASLSNSGNFYIHPAQGGIEIWQGKFAPKGEKRLMVLAGVTAPEPAKSVYTKADVFPLIFDYYVGKADAILGAPGIPDLEERRAYLEQALPFAVTTELKEIAYARLDGIDRLILLYKADVAAEKDTIEGIENALGYLTEAGKLVPDEVQAAIMAQKAQAFEARLAALQSAAREAEAQAAQEAEAAAKTEAEEAAGENTGNVEPPAEH